MTDNAGRVIASQSHLQRGCCNMQSLNLLHTRIADRRLPSLRPALQPRRMHQLTQLAPVMTSATMPNPTSKHYKLRPSRWT